MSAKFSVDHTYTSIRSDSGFRNLLTYKYRTGRIHDQAHSHFSSIIGWKALRESVELFGADSPATILNADLTGIDPDDYFSTVPYGMLSIFFASLPLGIWLILLQTLTRHNGPTVEKGFNLLYHIEKIVGGPEVFEPYVRAHVQRFASKSITTEEWQEYMFEFFETQYGDEVINKLKTIDFEVWLRGTGMVGLVFLLCLRYMEARRLF